MQAVSSISPAAPRTFLNTEVVMASSVVLILFVMVIPLPTFIMDLLLALNIAFSLAILLTAFYAVRPLEFAVFPGLLLLTTLFRLSLNVASTRLILSNADAGSLISAFGNFVVAGNYVVGAIIFLVLVIINFVVITKGSGRIAEVAARFTLDALPGKQMAIDGELNSGMIDESEARRRRIEVGREADFYGAMDGASKFVRGDAIAGLIITAINIVGGLIIGVFQRGMPMASAGETYSLLSIGDGLVSQVPALLISTAAGIIVSRASSESNIAEDFKGQILAKPYPILITGGFLLVLGVVPGLPLIPFWILAALAISIGRFRMQTIATETAEAEVQEAEEASSETKPSELVMVDPLELEIGYGLIPIVDPAQGGDLLDRIGLLRQQLALELGVVIPPIRIRDNVSIDSNTYIVKLRNNPIASGEVLPGYHMALIPDGLESLPSGIETTDPTYGLPAMWISERSLDDAAMRGMAVVEAPAVVTTHLLEVLRKNAHKLLDRQEVKKLLEQVKQTAPALVEELEPAQVTVGMIQKVLKRLLRERIPIRDLVTILETLADNIGITKSIDVLTEYVRAALAATITRQFKADDERLHVAVLEPSLEQLLLDRAQKGELSAATLGLDNSQTDRLIQAADAMTKQILSDRKTPALLTSPVIRPTLFAFLEPLVPDLAVLSYNDLVPDAQVEVVAQLQIGAPTETESVQ